MNEHRRLELERLFDGELPPGEADRVRASLADDPLANRYLARLAKLRELCRQPVAQDSSQGPAIYRRERTAQPATAGHKNLWWATAAAVVIAAGLASAYFALPRRNSPNSMPAPAQVARRLPGGGLQSHERPDTSALVSIHRLDNQGGPVAVDAGRQWLLAAASPAQRDFATEVLVLELANRRPELCDELERLTVSRQRYSPWRPLPAGRWAQRN